MYVVITCINPSLTFIDQDYIVHWVGSNIGYTTTKNRTKTDVIFIKNDAYMTVKRVSMLYKHLTE